MKGGTGLFFSVCVAFSLLGTASVRVVSALTGFHVIWLPQEQLFYRLSALQISPRMAEAVTVAAELR